MTKTNFIKVFDIISQGYDIKEMLKIRIKFFNIYFWNVKYLFLIIYTRINQDTS